MCVHARVFVLLLSLCVHVWERVRVRETLFYILFTRCWLYIILYAHKSIEHKIAIISTYVLHLSVCLYALFVCLPASLSASLPICLFLLAHCPWTVMLQSCVKECLKEKVDITLHWIFLCIRKMTGFCTLCSQSLFRYAFIVKFCSSNCAFFGAWSGCDNPFGLLTLHTRSDCI